MLHKQSDLSSFLKHTNASLKLFDDASSSSPSSSSPCNDEVPMVTEAGGGGGGGAVRVSVLSSFSDLTSAEMTQLHVVPGDAECVSDAAATALLFPVGALDVNRQQLDLRTENRQTNKHSY